MIIFPILAASFLVCAFTVPSTTEQKVYSVIFAVSFMTLYIVLSRAVSHSNRPTRARRTAIAGRLTIPEAASTYAWHNGYNKTHEVNLLDANGELNFGRGCDTYAAVQDAKFLLQRADRLADRNVVVNFGWSDLNEYLKAYNERAGVGSRIYIYKDNVE